MAIALFVTPTTGDGYGGVDRVSRELIEDALFHIFFSILSSAVTIARGHVRVGLP